MFTLIPLEIEDYCEAHTSEESDLLHQLYRETNLKALRPRMISGQLQGRFLSFISKIINPQHILEIGTYTGYATLCLAEGLGETGSIDTIEIDEELKLMIDKYFAQSPYQSKITLHIGDANELIPQLPYQWDLVFMDAEKRDYINYYELLIPRMKKNGVILADNVLWSGKVVKEVAHNDKETQAILAFNDHVMNDKRVSKIMLPFRDGMSLIIKN